MENCSTVDKFRNKMYDKRVLKEILCVAEKSYSKSCRLLDKSPDAKKGMLLYDVLVK